jgi:hypothetical protein
MFDHLRIVTEVTPAKHVCLKVIDAVKAKSLPPIVRSDSFGDRKYVRSFLTELCGLNAAEMDQITVGLGCR